MNHNEHYAEWSKALLHNAFWLAANQGQRTVGSQHILWAITRDLHSPAAAALKDAGLDQSLVQELVERFNAQASASAMPMLTLSNEAARILELAHMVTLNAGHAKVEPEHFLLAMLQNAECNAAKLIGLSGANTMQIAENLSEKMGRDWPRTSSVHASAGRTRQNQELPKRDTLNEYSRDLTAMAQEGKLDPVIGREDEIARVVQILSRRTKNNPVLIGEAGVGKTAVAEGLAQMLISGNVPENLSGYRLLSLDLTKMIAGTKYRGEFEERIKAYIEEAAEEETIILFIDELHMLIGAGAAEGAIDAANILKPALSRGEIQVIGATTLNEYRKHIEKDAALSRRFQPVTINEPTLEQTIEIMRGLRSRYEEHHGLTIQDEAIEAAVALSSRYIQDRYLPDKAIDLVDEAASRVRTAGKETPPLLQESKDRIAQLTADKQSAVERQAFEEAATLRDEITALNSEVSAWRSENKSERCVGEDDIAAVVSAWTGIPVTMLTEDESERLRRLEDVLHQRVVGQDEAVTAVAKAIRRARLGIKDPRRPVGTFLFLGPTGVGKTELCKALAEALFADEHALLRLDMSEYMERHTVSRLIGSPPGYVGYDDGGQLTEKVRRKPYSVVLFDEIEKAHPDVWSILLQIMDDGRLTDAQGRTVDFRNAIIVMTSNIGAKSITDRRSALGFSIDSASTEGVKTTAEIRDKVTSELRNTFRPEFINRIDDIIVFHQLDREQIREIAHIVLKELSARVSQMGVRLTVDEEGVDLLVARGFDPVYGARPLRRTIQSLIEDRAVELFLELGKQSCGQIVFSVRDGELEAEVIPCAQEAQPEVHAAV